MRFLLIFMFLAMRCYFDRELSASIVKQFTLLNCLKMPSKFACDLLSEKSYDYVLNKKLFPRVSPSQANLAQQSIQKKELMSINPSKKGMDAKKMLESLGGPDDKAILDPVIKKHISPRYPKDMLFILGDRTLDVQFVSSQPVQACDHRAQVDMGNPKGPRDHHQTKVVTSETFILGGHHGPLKSLGTSECVQIIMHIHMVRVSPRYIPEMLDKEFSESLVVSDTKTQMIICRVIETHYFFVGSDETDIVSRKETNQWTSRAPMNVRRSGAGAAALNGRIYVSGGFKDLPYSKSAVAKYDPDLHQWSTIKPMLKPRSSPACVAVGDFIYVMGGLTSNGLLASGQRYDTLRDSWSYMEEEMVEKKCSAAAVALDVEFVSHEPVVEAYDHHEVVIGENFILGGHHGPFNVFNSSRKLTLLTFVWTTIAPMRKKRAFMACVVIENHIAGCNGSWRVDTVECYYVNLNQWTSRAPMNVRRSGAGAAALNGRIYVSGGFKDLTYYKSVDPDLNQWSTIEPTLKPRSSAIGGLTSNGLQASGERYDTLRDSWSYMEEEMVEKKCSAAAVVLDEKIFVIGGWNGVGGLRTVEVWSEETKKWVLGTKLLKRRTGCSACVVPNLENVQDYVYLSRESLVEERYRNALALDSSTGPISPPVPEPRPGALYMDALGYNSSHSNHTTVDEI